MAWGSGKPGLYRHLARLNSTVHFEKVPKCCQVYFLETSCLHADYHCRLGLVAVKGSLMKISIRRMLGLSLLGIMLATAVPSFASPQGGKKGGGKKGGKSGKGAQKKGGKGSGK
jgi:hypothetical protein